MQKSHFSWCKKWHGIILTHITPHPRVLWKSVPQIAQVAVALSWMSHEFGSFLKGCFSIPEPGVSWRTWETLLASLRTHSHVTETMALVLCTWHFWSTSLFSATRYGWLFSTLFILFNFFVVGVEKRRFPLTPWPYLYHSLKHVC